jgi:hypothetical protein
MSFFGLSLPPMSKLNEWGPKVISGSEAEAVLINNLMSSEPRAIARFGSNEIKAVLYPKIPFFIKPAVKKRILDNLYTVAGFFPTTEKNIKRFSALMVEDMQIIDVLASWRIEERLLKKYLLNAQKIKFRTLEPYFSNNPWSQTLKDKNVLVIHPFNKSIEKQYHERRHLLFPDKRILPEFKSLQTIKAVQTIAGNKSTFKDWFEGLNCMKSEIDSKDFDIAIIGCGAYGFPLAAHVKRIGKKAVHLGGPTQILFGIKGKRWEENPAFDNIINEYFVYPSKEERPENAELAEGGCYW